MVHTNAVFAVCFPLVMKNKMVMQHRNVCIERQAFFFFSFFLSSPSKSRVTICQVHLQYYNSMPLAGRILTLLQRC